MKKVLRFCYFVIIALALVGVFNSLEIENVSAAEGECSNENGCRVGASHGEIWTSGLYGVYRPLTSSTTDTRNKYARNYWEDTADRPYLHYLHPFSDIGVTAIYNGAVANTYGFNVYYNRYGIPLFCLDGNLEGNSTVYAERFLIDDSYSDRVQAHDYALMSILTSGSNTYSDTASYWAKLTAIRAINVTFGLDKTNLGGSSVSNQYAIYGLVNRWLSEDSSDYDTIASYVTVKSRSSFAAYSNYYFQDTNGSGAVANARSLYFEALSVAAEYLENGGLSVNYTEENSAPSDIEILNDPEGELVSADIYHEFTITGLTNGDSFVINDELQFEKEYQGITDAYIKAIQINGEDISLDQATTFQYLNTNILEAVPGIDLSEGLHIVVTVHIEGFQTVNEGSSFEAINCAEQPFKYSLTGTYTASSGGAYDNYVATIWYAGTGNTQRYVGIEEGTGSEKTWSSPKEVTLVEECPGMCDQLFDECEENPGSDACQEYEELCDSTCETTVSNFDCCDANNELIISTIDNQEVTIDGPEDVQACFVDRIDAQVEAEGDASDVNGTSDDENNSYKLGQNKYCVVSCKEDYVMTMPTAKLVNAGRYFTFSAAVEGTKTCYTNTIDRELYNEDIINAQVEMVNAYTNYLMWKALDEAPIRDRTDSKSASPCCRECTGTGEDRTCSCTCSASDSTNVWTEYYVSGARYTYYYVTDSNKNFDNGTITISNRSASASYDEDGHIEGSCSSGCCYANCRDGSDGSAATLAANIDRNLASAISRLEAAQRAYREVIEEYNDCSEWNDWDAEIKYDPEIYYDYEESYLADMYHNYGSMDSSLVSSGTTEWYCNSNVSSNGRENQAELNGISYSSCDGSTSASTRYTRINYIYCTVDGCEITPEEVSDARYKKVTSSQENSYIPSTLFYNIYPSGEIVDAEEGASRDDAVAIENGLPVSLSTERGIYKYTINITDLGEYYDANGTLGRLIGGRNAVINRNDYSNIVNSDGEVEYACSYLVNMGVTDDTHIYCDFNTECTGEDCYSDCVGPNCYGDENTCSGDNCIADCIGAGCIYDSDAGTSLIERVVSLNNLFPNGTDSYNWNRDINEKADATISEIQEKGNSVYDEDPVLSVTITPSTARAIKEYNDKAENDGGYSNSTLACYSLDGYEEIACYSSFITDLLNGTITYDRQTLANNLDIVNNRSLIMGNNYRTVSDNNFEYFTTWDSGISEEDMIGPSWK